MNTHDFIHRTITKELILSTNEGTVVARVHRTRTSMGAAWITVEYGHQRLEFKDDTVYEDHARQLADALLEIIKNPCSLPKVEETK